MQFGHPLGWSRSVILALVVGSTLTSSTYAQDPSPLGDDLKLGRCAAFETFALVVHGGTVGRPNKHESGSAFIARLLEAAEPALADGATSVDLVHGAVRAMEDSGLFNAGQGARANRAGVVEMDAAIMDGKRLNAGAVASVKTVKNPITAARLVMRRSPQVLIVGPDAEAYAARNRGTIVGPDYFRLSGLNFDDIPFPHDIEITEPDPSLPGELSAYSGVWGGVLNGALTVLLAVEEVTASGARVVFGHGIDPGRNLHSGHAARYRADLVRDTLEISVNHPRKGKISFRIGADGQMEAVYYPHNQLRAATSLERFDAVPRPEKHGTVGAVALDRCGNLAAGTSTGGYGSKVPGRVGDSPIIGAGTYANNNTAAISATGHGESFMRLVIAYDISARMEYGGFSLGGAARKVILEKLTEANGRGGVIAVDAKGNIATVFNTHGMLRGAVTNLRPPAVEVY